MASLSAFDRKTVVEAALKAFGSQPLEAAALELFGALGYRSERRLDLTPNTPAQFLAAFAQGRSLRRRLGTLGDWRSADFLFRLREAVQSQALAAEWAKN